MEYVLLNTAVESASQDNITVELILSIIAIIVSVSTAIFEYMYNKKINRTNLEAEFFITIYGKSLMEKIPKARQVIHYDGVSISDTQDLIDELNNIRLSSLFYKYSDRTYYDELCNKLQSLEDVLIKTDKLSGDDYAVFINNLNLRLENIYHFIMNKYIGKRKKYILNLK